MLADPTLANVALAAGLAWASGIRLYVVVFLLGAAGYLGWYTLPEHLQVLQHPVVLGTSGALAVAEFLADKIPGFDSLWDAVHTFIRIPAGALLAAGAIGGLGPDSVPLMVAAGLVGGTITAGSHFTKAGARLAINHSPEPVSNWLASGVEDVAAPGILWTALVAPGLLLGLLLLAILAAAWLLPRLWRWIAQVLRRLRPA